MSLYALLHILCTLNIFPYRYNWCAKPDVSSLSVEHFSCNIWLNLSEWQDVSLSTNLSLNFTFLAWKIPAVSCVFFFSSFSSASAWFNCRSAGWWGREADVAGLQHAEGKCSQPWALALRHRSKMKCGVCAWRCARLTGRSVGRWSFWRMASLSGVSPTKHPVGPRSSNPVSMISTTPCCCFR